MKIIINLKKMKKNIKMRIIYYQKKIRELMKKKIN